MSPMEELGQADLPLRTPRFAPPPYHLMSDVSFPDLDALKACATSAGGQEALQHAASISSDGAPTVLVVTKET
jgi:hypothetical protein